TLCDQCVAETCASSLRQNFCSQGPRPLPIVASNFNPWHSTKRFGDLRRQLRIAQQFGEHHGNHQQLPVSQRLIEELSIARLFSFKKRYPGTRVLLSSFRSVAARENLTFPRNSRSRV